MFWRSVRVSIVGLFIICGLGFGLAAQQGGGGLTPPPKPGAPKPTATKAAAPASTGGAPFQIGERLSFNVSWSNFVTAARLELEVADRGAFFGQDGYQLRAKVETMGYVRSIFTDLDNQYTAYVDAKTALPYRAENSIRHGLNQEDISIVFDQLGHTARYPDGSSVTIPPNTYDLASLIYALRLRNLKAGESYKCAVLYDKETIEIEALVKPRERVISQAGSYDAIRVELTTKSKKFNLSKYRVRAWFSDDAQHLPVTITAQLPFGEVRAELSSAVIVAPTKPKIATRPDPPTETPLFTPKSSNPSTGAPPIPPKGKSPAETGSEGMRDGEASPEAERNLPFVAGERLNYDASWLNLASVGRMSFEVRQQGRLNNQPVFEFVGEAATLGAARSIISLDDQIICYANANTLIPIRSDLRLREGERNKQTTADYDPSGTKVTLSNGTQVSVQPKTLDLLSLFYAVRAADLKVGSTHVFPFLDANHRQKRVVIKVVKQETILSPMGTQDTVQLDIFSQDTQLLIAQAWITNDARRLPVYIVTRTGFGELRLQLTSTVKTK